MRGLFAIFAFCVAAAVSDISPQRVSLLGAKECTWGPSYWCTNLTAAASCHATKHCIQTVWPHKMYPEDKSSICETCLDMVQQARDQLESNETQEEIKEVFEGSCNLIPIKVISEECCKLADDFIPELIDTLASQMNPQTVCSVAGLCNNAKHQQLLLEYENSRNNEDKEEKRFKDSGIPADTCAGCNFVVNRMTQKFNKMPRDEFLQRTLQVCALMGSFSDACSNIVISNFEGIYEQLQKEFRADSICTLSGECSAKFHKHPEIEVTPMGHVGYVDVPMNGGDDPACKLCKQLVGHLRDLLIADTTEAEFQKVLEGLCKQTNSFKDECLTIVDEYYPFIYKYLVDGLNTTVICDYATICPGPGFEQIDGPIAPLLLDENQSKLNALMTPKSQTAFEAQQPEQMQLPIERIGSPFIQNNAFNKEVCAFCQYLLHYIQQEITDPHNEQELKSIVNKACDRLPNSVSETCVAFVNSYGEAFIALLAEEVDPSTICPLIRVCPSSKTQDIEVFMQGTPEGKPNCPLCLLAVTKLEDLVRDGKTKDKIEYALNNLCSHLSSNLRTECEDFVKSYTNELVEMLIDDFKPQEICVYLKICKDSQPPSYNVNSIDIVHSGNIETNEIPDYTSNGKANVQLKKKAICPLCQFVMEQLEKDLEDKSTEDEIKQAIHDVCNHMPKTLNRACNKFVDKYAELVFNLISSSVDPKEVCTMMNLCDEQSQMPPVGTPTCYLCKRVLSVIESYIGSVPESSIENTIKTICSILPRDNENACDKFIDQYGDMIYNILKEGTDPSEICSILFLCSTSSVTQPEMELAAQKAQHIVTQCGICRNVATLVEDLLANPNLDHRPEHVLQKACAAMPNKRQKQCADLVDHHGNIMVYYLAHLGSDNVCKEIKLCNEGTVSLQKRELAVGANKCTWGPSYWCENANNAKQCGAVNHCQEKVWKKDQPQ